MRELQIVELMDESWGVIKRFVDLPGSNDAEESRDFLWERENWHGEQGVVRHILSDNLLTDAETHQLKVKDNQWRTECLNFTVAHVNVKLMN